VREFCLNGVDAAWLSDDERATMRREFEEEIAALEAKLER
jgi:hypothetical protein